MDRAPNLFAYIEYREYLRAWVEYQRRLNPGFTYAAFAAASGLAKSTLPNILSGSRSPATETLDALAVALELTPNERNYLGLLVEYERAPSVAERRRVLQRIGDRDAFGRTGWIADGDDAFLAFAANWYYPVVMELARDPAFRLDPEWVAQAVLPPISPREAREALDALLELGLLVPDGDGGASVSVIRLQTPPESAARATVLFHMAAVPALLGRLDQIPPDERHVTGAVIALPEKVLPEAKALVHQIVSQLALLGDDQTDTGRRAYLVAAQLMPVSRPRD